MLAPMLFNMFFTAVLRVAEKRFLADAAITGNMVQLQQKKEKGEKKCTSCTGNNVNGRRGKEEEVQRLLGMLYADDAGIVSRSSERLERMMTVIVTSCSAFGLTASEPKKQIMCLQIKGGGRRRSQSMQPARYKNKNRVCVLGRGYRRGQRPLK